MRLKNRMAKLVLCALMLFSFAASACAAEGAYSDVSGGEWYAEAVMALREKGIMDGVGGNSFEPDGKFTRTQLATVLYRLAGEPAVKGEDDFSDTESGKWYSEAVLWASQNGVVNGYGNGKFGTSDPASQEQLVLMLWRSAGSYVLGSEYADADGAENFASDWAFDAVRWARVDGLLTDAVPFEAKAVATRAQVADMVYRYLGLLERFSEVDTVSGATKKPAEGDTTKETAEGGNVLVAYFSCTGTTERIAGYIAESLGAATYQIVPAEPYTAADLNYNDSSTRATKEQNDPSARPAIAGGVENMDDYNVIFLGYPIWWGQAPKIMYSFVEGYELGGKTIVPFCTSGSSGIGSSAENLSKSAPDADWLPGNRFGSGASRETVADWVNALDLELSGEQSMTLKIGQTEVPVTWEDNPSVAALKSLRPLEINMSKYGGFEQVGPIGRSIERNDEQISADFGDIVLYSGDQIVIFYGSNSWAYTRLGHVDLSREEMAALLGGGDVTITIS
jgi:flavodoxin